MKKSNKSIKQKRPIKRHKPEENKTINNSESSIVKPTEWTNKQKILIMCSRGVSCRARHLSKNLQILLPHSKPGIKLDIKHNLNEAIAECMDDHHCNKVIFLEMRKKNDLYMWIAAGPDGPTVKFHVQNLHTMEELRMTGNCLKASRPILSFDQSFDRRGKHLYLNIIKELLSQCFNCPLNHPLSQPFIDHVFAFSWIDNRIWFRNYQIVDFKTFKLAEIGPRLCLQPIFIQENLFGGPLIYRNDKYVSPNLIRRMRRQRNEKGGRFYGMHALHEVEHEERVPSNWPVQEKAIADPIFE